MPHVVSLSVAALLAAIPATHAWEHYITVGKGGNKYDPPFVHAKIGDKVKFQFFPKNHTVTQSPFDTPCTAQAYGISSGFQPVSDDYNTKWFEFEVKEETPLWFYCQQAKHCSEDGMVFAVNPPTYGDKTFDAFQQLAKKQYQDAPAPPKYDDKWWEYKPPQDDKPWEHEQPPKEYKPWEDKPWEHQQPPKDDKPWEHQQPPKEDKPWEDKPWEHQEPPKDDKPWEHQQPPKDDKPWEHQEPPKTDDKPWEHQQPPKDDKPWEHQQPPKDDKPWEHQQPPKNDDKPWEHQQPPKDDKPWEHQQPPKDDKPWEHQQPPKTDDKPWEHQQPPKDDKPWEHQQPPKDNSGEHKQNDDGPAYGGEKKVQISGGASVSGALEGSDASSSGGFNKWAPVVLGLLGANLLVGLILVVLTVISYRRKGGRESTRSINVSYAPLREKGNESYSRASGSYRDDTRPYSEQ